MSAVTVIGNVIYVQFDRLQRVRRLADIIVTALVLVKLWIGMLAWFFWQSMLITRVILMRGHL